MTIFSSLSLNLWQYMDYTYDTFVLVFPLSPSLRAFVDASDLFLSLPVLVFSCMTNFSSGQATRMVAQAQTYRGL